MTFLLEFPTTQPPLRPAVASSLVSTAHVRRVEDGRVGGRVGILWGVLSESRTDRLTLSL